MFPVLRTSSVALESTMVRQPLLVTPQTLVTEAIARMHQAQVAESLVPSRSIDPELSCHERCTSCVLVVDDQRLVGILTERDVLRLSATGQSLQGQTIATVMTSPVFSLQQTELTDLAAVFTWFQQHRVRHLPIVDANQQVLGLLTLEGVQSWATAQEIAHLETKVQDLEVAQQELLQTCMAELEQQIQQRTAELTQQAERERAETALRQSEATKRAIIEALPDLLIHTNRWGGHLEYLSAGEVTVLRPPPDLENPTLFDSLPRPIANRQLEAIQQALGTGNLQTYEQQIEINQQLRWEEVRVAPLTEDEVILIVRDISDRKQTEIAFQTLVEGAAAIAGENFFAELVRYIAAVLKARCVVVATHSEDTLTSAALWMDGQLEGNITYPMEHAPCNLTFNLGQYICFSGVRQQFPGNPLLDVLEAEAYVGVALSNSQGDTIGCLYVVDSRPLLQPQFAIAMLRVFAARVSAELERQEAIDALKQLNQQLEHRIERRTIELQNSEARFRRLFEQNPLGIAVSDLQGQITRANSSLRQILGYSETALLQCRIQDLLPADRRQQGEQRLEKFMEQTLSVMAQEEQLISRQGDVVWVNLTSALMFDMFGRPSEIVHLIEDISTRKAANEALNRQLAAIEAVIDGIAILSGKTYTYVNRAHLELFGYERAEELVGRNWDCLYSVAEQRRFEQEVFPLLLRDHHWQGEAIATRKDGSTFMEGLSLTLTDRGEWICVCRDITPQKQAEAQLQQTNEQLILSNAELARATRLKDEFLANMSHELRTPLNAILGMAEGLQENVFGEISVAQERAIATIDRSGRHLLELINDILDLSKIESGRLELQIAPVSVHYLCESSLTFVRQQAIRKNIQLTSKIPSNLPDLSVDERRIRQVLINLLNNAVKFTPDGGTVTLTVSTGKQQEQAQTNCVIRFEIRDTGIGIDSEDLTKLFQPFVQIDSSFTRQYAGTGLGLALVRQLTQLHNGTVIVTSEVGQGSCFTVQLPYSCSRPTPVLAPAPSAKTALPATPPIVLMVEDAPPATEQLSRYLVEIGWQSVVCSQGQKALETALNLQPNLIILDLMLPDLPGWDVLAQLKAHPQTREIPVLIVSVLDERSQGLASGAFEYLVKPITRETFHQVLTKIQALPTVSAAPVPPPTLSHPPLVLLAEDNPANVATLSGYLSSRGFRLIVAENGLEAITLTETEHPDLILMDIQMPMLDGLSAIRQIRANPTIAQMPIIALTALAMPSDEKKCLDAGANGYLTKPVRLKSLVELMHSLLKNT